MVRSKATKPKNLNEGVKLAPSTLIFFEKQSSCYAYFRQINPIYVNFIFLKLSCKTFLHSRKKNIIAKEQKNIRLTISFVTHEITCSKKRGAIAGVWWAGSDRRCDDAFSHMYCDVR